MWAASTSCVSAGAPPSASRPRMFSEAAGTDSAAAAINARATCILSLVLALLL